MASLQFKILKNTMKNNNLLKTYTILLPIYKEELMLDQIIQAIENLKYPKNLLQVLFLLEKIMYFRILDSF